MKKSLPTNLNGFSLIEALVTVFIIMILMIGVYSLILLSLKITSDNKMYVQAIEIANQKMEQIRNLPYTDVGTALGSPNGPILDNEIVVRDGTFYVHTVIQYFDDPFDSTAIGTDTIWDDYKIATVEVNWSGRFKDDSISIFSKIIPNTEETDSGNGLLRLSVVDSNGAPVPGADIHIENMTTGIPNVDLVSNASGELAYSAPPGFEAYYIRVTKPGYGVDQTYERNAGNPNPSKPHLTVVEGDKTEESFSIDQLAILTVHTIDTDLPDNWQINTDVGGDTQQDGQMIIDSTGNIYMVWQDSRNGAFKIMGQKYDSSANPLWPDSFSPDDVFISTANNTIIPDIKIDSMGNLYAAWFDNSVGNKEVYICRLDNADGDHSWGGEIKVNTLSDADDQSSPRITVRDNGVSATTSMVFVDDRSGDLDIYLQIFEDNGDEYNNEILLTTATYGDGTNQYNAEIESDGSGGLYILWTDDRNIDLDVYFSLYDEDGNLSWEIEAPDDVSSSDQYDAAMAIDSIGNIYVVWTDLSSGDADIMMQKFDSSGTAQWGSDVRVNTDAGLEFQTEPVIAVDNLDNIYIIWTDERNGNKDIYAQKYNTSGTALWANDLRVNINADNSDQYTPDIAIDPTTNTPYASWTDERNGNFDIYATAFDYYATGIPVGNLEITVHGSKRIGEPPPGIIYEYDITTTTDASGIKNLLVEWDVPGYTLGVTAASGYVLMLTEPTLPVPVLPNTNIDAYMYVE